MSERYLTNKEARQFMLIKQGLLGDYKFKGKQGILDFIHQAGCIQFDPIDICGKNAELVLQARIKNFRKSMLYDLLYKDRKLIDYFDKNLSIFAIEDWKYFERERENHRKWERSHNEITQVHDKVLDMIAKKGPLCSADLEMNEKVDWYWSSTKISRAALEHMYFSGELAVHHKNGTIKYYDLIENCIPENILAESEPFPDDNEHKKWRVLRRIASIGLLWNRASDAWLGIPRLKADERNNIFSSLLTEGKIIPVRIEGIEHTFYCPAADMELIDYLKTKPRIKKRCEFIAPLDNMMWDRNLIKAIFNFDYKWEIYTPKDKRKYGYYVLPILYGDQFIGRIELIYNKKNCTLSVPNIWYEPNTKQTTAIQDKVTAAIRKFEIFALTDM